MLDVLLQFRPQPLPGGGIGLTINLVSIGLLLALLVVFIGTWRKTRAPFTLGLVLFVGVLLLEDLTRVSRVLGLLGTRPGAELLPDFFEIIALVVLLYLATR